ncbi:TPA: type II toxin-antitoxin system HicB family antitoxin [Legionella pneumophila]|nr:type II toxin-antitoxin system HicB family antitoxin [Legionella pneumophila]
MSEELKDYPAILEPTSEGYSVYFPDLPGAVSAGYDSENAINNAEECLSFHLQGMLEDNEIVPEPTHLLKLEKELSKGEKAVMIHPSTYLIKHR